MSSSAIDERFDWEGAYGRLAAEAERDYPEPWTPEEPGDEILGRVVAVRASVPTSYGPSPVVELETAQGPRSLWLFSTVLRRAFERERVELGELVLVRFRGMVHPDGGGNPYRDFRLVVDRPNRTGRPDWQGIASRYGDEGALDDVLEVEPAAGDAPLGPAPAPGDGADDIPF